MKYLVIGCSSAGIHAMEAIRQKDATGEITCLTKEQDLPYGRPLISYWLEGKIREEKMSLRPQEFFDRLGIRLCTGVEAVRLDLANRSVLTATGQSFTYDRLFLGCGGKPIVPPIEGLKAVPHFFFHTLADVKKIKLLVTPEDKVLIIGGGLIGLKAAESLTSLNARVTVVDLAPHLLSSIMGAGAAYMVQEAICAQGVEVKLNNSVAAVRMIGPRELAVTLKDGVQLMVNHLVVAVGVAPNLDLVQGTALSHRRGLLVDQHMQTNISGVYAGGDMVEFREMLSGQQKVVGIVLNAAMQGRVAGYNMAGFPLAFDGSMVCNSLNLFATNIVTMGESTAAGENKEILVSRPAPGVYRELVFRDGRLCGATLINDAERAGILRHLIYKQVEVDEVKEGLLAKTPQLLEIPFARWDEYYRDLTA
ncbi:MAG TPA: NAD(P)/FAD-dependent oxidoreductase [Firmicutes bacterium]|nr:NAD(P)/FAD-dependent oxidoreductase [Bacillota bacterium]